MVARIGAAAVVAAVCVAGAGGAACADEVTPSPTPSVVESPSPSLSQVASEPSATASVVLVAPDESTAEWLQAATWALGALVCLSLVQVVGGWAR